MIFILSSLSSSTVYFTVPLPLILWIPKPSTDPSLFLRLIKSNLQFEIVKEHPESRIISILSLSKWIWVLESRATCAPRNDSILDTVGWGILFVTVLLTVFNKFCLIPSCTIFVSCVECRLNFLRGVDR